MQLAQRVSKFSAPKQVKLNKVVVIRFREMTLASVSEISSSKIVYAVVMNSYARSSRSRVLVKLLMA